MMRHLLLLLLFCTVGVKCQTCSYRDYGRIPGDIALGFMFPYAAPYFHGDICSTDINDFSNIQLVEAAIFAVKKANNDNLIPGVTIGLEAWDSCHSVTVATDRSISFLGDRKVSYEQNIGDNCGSQFKAAMVADLQGARGPAVAALLSDAQSPVISYAATLPSLSSSSRYKFFSRTIPSDREEAKAIIGLLVSQGWRYISLVYSDTTEDQAEAEIFQEEAKKAKICIAYSKVISLDSSFQEVASAALEISQESTTLIVAFISSTSLLSSFANLADTSKFNFIVGHRLFVDLIKGNSFSLNVMSVAPSFMEMTVNDEFDRYFTSLSPSSADMMANLWFVSFWEQSYGCTIGVSCGPAQQTQHMQTYRRNPYVSSVLNTVNTVIDALNSLHAAKCQNAPGPCEDFMTTTPEEIQEEIRQTNIRTGSGSTVTSFSGMGDPSPGEYFVWRVDTSTGAQTRLGRILDGQTTLESNNGLDSITASCGNPCMDPVCLDLEEDEDEITVQISGDVLLAGFFSVNEWNDVTKSCDSLSHQGVLQLEAMLYAINNINQDPSILPTVSIGFEGLNTCGDSQRASHQALRLVSEFDFGQSASGTRVVDSVQKQHLYGIVGPGSNEESMSVSSIVKTYGVTMVSYEADSYLLSSSSVPNFARVVPTYISSLFPVAATLGEWNFLYVSVLLSAQNYPIRSIIESYLNQYDVCLAQSLQVPEDDSGWDAVFESLSSTPEAKAILISASSEEIQRLMREISQRNLTGQYFLVTDDNWVLDDDFTAMYEDVARGVLAIKSSPRQYSSFQSYVAGLDPATNSQNPWFRRYWMERFSCNLQGEQSEFRNPCTGNEELDPTTDVNDATVAYVIDAVYTIAEALHRLHTETCGSTYVGVCDAMDLLSGDEVFREVVSQPLQSKNEDGLNIVFTRNGDSNIPYHIYNMQQNGPVEVASFSTFQLTRNLEPAIFYNSDGSERTNEIYSVCNQTRCLQCERNGRDAVATTPSGDVWIGGFFEITEPEDTQIECSDRLILYNMQLLEAFRFAIQQVNQDPDILPDLKLAGIGFDSCGSKKRVGKEVGNFYSGTVDYRPGYNPNRIAIAGMIGGGTSDTTQALSNTLVNLDIATVSYGATSTMFSNSKMFPHVVRTVPSDEKQAAAMVDVLTEFGWNYISIIYSDNSYGADILEQFRLFSKGSSICVAMTLALKNSDTSPKKFESLIDILQTNQQARVVLLLTSDLHTRSVLQAAERKEVTNIQWVGGDTWGSKVYVSQGAETTSLGAITIRFRESETTGFREYFTSLTAYSNQMNPWWRNFWSDTFQCNLATGRDHYDTNCPFFMQTLDEDFVQAPEVTYVVNAVKAMASGLHQALGELCPGVTNHLCSNLMNNPDTFFNILKSVSFTGADGEEFRFDSKGDGPAEYDIMNFRPREDGRLVYARLGRWVDGSLEVATPSLYSDGQQISLGQSRTNCVGRCDECLLLQDSARLFASLPGELQIPALVGVHEAPQDASQTCGGLREAGIVNVEAILYAVNAINEDDSLLRGVQLGTTIFDSCLSVGQGIRSLSSYLSRTGDFSDDYGWRHIGGILGAEDQRVATYLSDLSEQSEYVQVAYSSVDNSNSEFLMQTSPSLDQFYSIIQDILGTYDWNLVTLITDSRDVQQTQLAESIYRAQEDIGVCFDSFLEYTGSPAGRGSLESALSDSKSNVAILVMSLSTAEEMVRSVKPGRHLTFIIIDRYSAGFSATLPPELNGAIIVSTNHVTQGLDDHLASLAAGENAANPWFDEFITEKFGCILNGPSSQLCGSSDRIQDSSASINANYVIDGVYSLARAIDSFRKRMCGTDSAGLCKEFFEVTPKMLRDAVLNLEYRSEGNRLVTMRDGSAVIDFTVWNINKNGAVQMIGSWEVGTLRGKEIYFEDSNSVSGIVVSSDSACGMSRSNGSTGRQVSAEPSLDDSSFFVLLILCGGGIIISLIFLICVIVQHHSPQAQVYSIFLIIVLLVSVICIFAQNLLFSLVPSNAVCGLRRVAFNVSHTSAFLASFLITVRIYRILAREKRITGSRALYINNKSQAKLFSLLAIIMLLIVAQALLFQPPSLVVGANNITHCRFIDGHYAISLMYMFFLMLATIVASILALMRSSTILSREIWLGFFCLIFCVILVAAWVIVGIITDIFDDNRTYVVATCFVSVVLGYLLLFFYLPIRIYNLFQKHDPFSDSASVISGEFREPQARGTNDYGAENGAHGGDDDHTYDSPVVQAKMEFDSKM